MEWWWMLITKGMKKASIIYTDRGWHESSSCGADDVGDMSGTSAPTFGKAIESTEDTQQMV